MAKYLNGYDAPSFKVWIPGQTNWTVITMNLRFQFFNEYLQLNYVEHKLKNGSYVRKFRYAEYFWMLDYSQLAEADEIAKLIRIMHYLQLNYTVLLYPHKEQQRYFDIIDDTEDMLTLGMHYGGINAHGNKDLVIKFKTRNQITTAGGSILWINIGNPNIPQEETGNVKFLTNEEDEYILTEGGELILA